MSIRIQQAPVPAGRVIAVSDVHGHAAYLRGLLARVKLTAEDALVVVGDLLEKGPESLETLREVMAVSQKTPVYWVAGNCDPLPDNWDPARVAHWVRMSRERLFRDMMEEAGMGMETLEDMDAYRRELYERFPRELAFMEGLPHVLKIGIYTFVHGGITNEPLEAQTPESVMKNDAYLQKGYAFERWVVVGHWPTQLLNRVGQSCAADVQEARHIISIDGGCVIKECGQLNALIIPRAAENAFSFDSYDGLETVTALDGQAERQPTVSVLYTDCAVEVVERGGSMSTIRLKSTGATLRAPTYKLYERDGEWRLDDYTDYEMPVRAGDVLKALKALPEGLYAKDAQGRVGWYRGRVRKA
jgi:diadenosine tetraphosphatase ApaH/serine/threonine PP2A family protein phosphatase